ncbi:hypothetical protein EDC04DRAFT_2816688, partial [Pisolithus marmoratus]
KTLALKVALIEATENWEKLTGGGPPCPVMFNSEDICETMKLDAEQRGVDKTLETRGSVPTEHYEEAVIHGKQFKEDTFKEANGLRLWCTVPWMTWIKRNTCNESS